MESFNGQLRDELLNQEIFDTLLEAQVLGERWRKHFPPYWPHSSLGYRSPAPEAILPSSFLASATLQRENCLTENPKTLSQNLVLCVGSVHLGIDSRVDICVFSTASNPLRTGWPMVERQLGKLHRIHRSKQAELVHNQVMNGTNLNSNNRFGN